MKWYFSFAIQVSCITLVTTQSLQAQENQPTPDSISTQVTKQVSDENEKLLPLATEIEKMNAQNPNNKEPVKIQPTVKPETVQAAAAEERIRQQKFREEPITRDNFKYFAAANYSLGKFHTTMGTISLLASIGSVITIIASASKNDDWDIVHTTAIIPAGIGLFSSTWEIGVGLKLKYASQGYMR